MDTMIEKVMFAIVNKRRTSFDIPALTDLKHLTEAAYYDYKLQAVAAIEAMREPNKAITNAMLECEDGGRSVQEAWRYLIDAALKE